MIFKYKLTFSFLGSFPIEIDMSASTNRVNKMMFSRIPAILGPLNIFYFSIDSHESMPA